MSSNHMGPYLQPWGTNLHQYLTLPNYENTLENTQKETSCGIIDQVCKESGVTFLITTYIKAKLKIFDIQGEIQTNIL